MPVKPAFFLAAVAGVFGSLTLASRVIAIIIIIFIVGIVVVVVGGGGGVIVGAGARAAFGVVDSMIATVH